MKSELESKTEDAREREDELNAVHEQLEWRCGVCVRRRETQTELEHVHAQMEDERANHQRSVERLERDIEENKKQLSEQLSVNAALRQEQLECKKQLNRERRRRDESEDVKKLREEKEKCVAAVWSEE